MPGGKSGCMSGMPGPEFFLLVIDDGKVVRIPGEAKAREEWCAVCREREFCFSCMKKPPDGMIAIRGFV